MRDIACSNVNEFLKDKKYKKTEHTIISDADYLEINTNVRYVKIYPKNNHVCIITRHFDVVCYDVDCSDVGKMEDFLEDDDCDMYRYLLNCINESSGQYISVDVPCKEGENGLRQMKIPKGILYDYLSAKEYLYISDADKTDIREGAYIIYMSFGSLMIYADKNLAVTEKGMYHIKTDLSDFSELEENLFDY